MQEQVINSIDSLQKLYSWVDQLRAELPLSDVVEILSERLKRLETGDVHYALAGDVRGFLTMLRRDREAEQLHQEIIERYPDDEIILIGKATDLLYVRNDLEGALKSIDLALEKIRRTRLFLRQAFGVKARVLLALGRGEQMSHVLEEIMSVQIDRNFPDVGRERDFIDRAPLGFISDDVLARYNQFRPRRPGDTTTNEPPLFEMPEELFGDPEHPAP